MAKASTMWQCVIAATIGLTVLCLLCEGAAGRGLSGVAHLQTMIGLPTNGLDATGIPAQQVVFSRENDWVGFWKAHSSAPAPLVDFARWQVVAVFLGPKPSPGYGLRIVDATETPSGTQVTYRQFVPAPGMMYAQVIVYPYDVVAIPAGKTVSFANPPPREREKPGPTQPVQARVLDAGGLAMPREARHLAFADRESWEAFWRGYCASAPPVVDFSRQIVVGAAQPSGGLEFAAADKQGHAIRIRLKRAPAGLDLKWVLVAVARAPRVDLGWEESQL